MENKHWAVIADGRRRIKCNLMIAVARVMVSREEG
jgi:hypothetical protein